MCCRIFAFSIFLFFFSFFARGQKNIQLQIDEWNRLAAMQLEHQPDTAIYFLQLALENAKKESYTQGLAQSHHYLGKILSSQGAFSQAIGHYFDAIDQYALLNNQSKIAETYNNLGDLYYYTQRMDEALQQHEKALAIYQENNLPKGQAMTLGFIGHFYEKQERYEKALLYQNQALKIYQELNDLDGLSTINGNLGSIYEDLEDFTRARSYFLLALEYNLQTNNELERIVHLNNIGDTYRKVGEVKKGIEYTQQSLELAQKLDQKYRIESGFNDLAKAYAQIGDFDRAYAYRNKAYDIYTDLYTQADAFQINRLKTLHDLSEKQKEIELLERENRIAVITRNTIIGGAIMILLLAGILLRGQRLKIKKNKELHETQQKLIQIELQNTQLNEQKLKQELEVNSSQLTNHALHIIQKNKMLKELKTKLDHLRQNHKEIKQPVQQLINKIDQNFNFDKDWEEFKQIFERVHPEFYQNLSEKYPELTSNEIRLCALLRLNLDSKDISTILGISQDSLRVSRYRLRKSLRMEKRESLTALIMMI